MTELDTVLRGIGRIAIAVSGGVDSLTLATAAHQTLRGVTMHHAVSPAVPPEATARTRAEAARQGWILDIFDAGEFAVPAYRENPVNRCFFCKTSLYGAIAARTALRIASGTNLDDLGDFRPGLRAAADHAVHHPFVEAKMTKADIRRLAAKLGLGDVADLPASPCLASRIETGLRIEAPLLALVHQAERLAANRLSATTIRCRVRRAGFVIELDAENLSAVSPEDRRALAADIAALGITQPISFAPYRAGSAFVRPAA